MQQAPGDVVMSSIVLHELTFGAFNSHRAATNLDRLAALNFPAISFDIDDARMAGEIRARLKRAGTPIGPYDLLIAGQALARDLTLVTANTREFTRVDGLRIENWIG
jgi:tRNA(fMet)-specific endonuclease VapC